MHKNHTMYDPKGTEMVFWISVAVIAVLLIVGFIATAKDYWEWSWFGGFAALSALLALIMCAVIGVGSTNPPGVKAELLHRYGLHALVSKDSTDSQISGSFFLGFGGVEGSSSTKTKIVYIEVGSDGGATIHDTTVGRSIIYEDVEPGGKPYMEDWVSAAWTNTVWVPWTWHYVVPGEPQHRFHIPKGSILTNYQVNP